MRTDNRYGEILDFISVHGAITIEIAANLFYQSKYGMDCSRRALNKLHENKLLRKHMDMVNGVNQYYDKAMISNHKLQLLRFYSYMVKTGADILQFDREYKSINAISDGLIIYKYNGKTKIILVEVDISHKTKPKKYEKLFEEGYFQKEFGTFPRVFILDNNPVFRQRKMISDKVKFVCIDFKFSSLGEVL